jgi:hypothetical protein
MRLFRLGAVFAVAACLGGMALPASSSEVALAAPTPATAACTPSITSVGEFQATASQSVEIEGSCFGTGATLNDSRNFYLQILDRSGSRGWSACYLESKPTVSCTVSSWTDSEITFSGFGANYGTGDNELEAGDQLVVAVWNPQTLIGPVTYQTSVVGAAQRPPLCVPKITSVGAIEPGAAQNILIQGSCLGKHPPYADANRLDLYIQDSSTSPVAWSACNSGDVNDIVRCTITKWTNDKIVLTEFDGYGGRFAFEPGDQIIVAVWNHPTSVGPGTYVTTVGSG